MKSYFADTSLFVAFLNGRDEYHELAVDYISQESNLLVTTDWVLVELGNYVSKSRTRRRFVPFVRDLRDDPWLRSSRRRPTFSSKRSTSTIADRTSTGR
jgi:predicted nucleic acid-binding protein